MKRIAAILALLTLGSCVPVSHYGYAHGPRDVIHTRTIPGGHYYPSRQVHTVYRTHR